MAEEKFPQAIDFHYLKSTFFRVVHIDGGIGGLTPSRNIFLSLYNQRGSLPDMIRQRINIDGTLGEEVAKSASHSGVIREMEVGLILGVQSARELGKWLQEQADALEALESKVERTKPFADSKEEA